MSSDEIESSAQRDVEEPTPDEHVDAGSEEAGADEPPTDHESLEQPEPDLAHTGVYEDIFMKTSEGWRIASRSILIDHK